MFDLRDDSGMVARWLQDGCKMADFVLRTTSVSPLDRDKDTLSLTRETGEAFRLFPV